MIAKTSWLLLTAAATVVLADCADHKPAPPHPLLVKNQLERRQRTATATRAATTPAASAAPPTGTTFTAGQVNTYVEGAPPLPDWSQINLGDYPALDRIPPVNSPQVQQWIREVEAKGAIPNVPLTGLNGCSNSTFNAQALRDAEKNAWWTCGGYTRDTDVTVCPLGRNVWGMSFDDGPSDDSPRLLNYLDANNLKSTFFIVGSRALSRPEILQREYMTGHEISVHTWSHNSLTTLSNEEIIAELGWTKEIIKAVIGVTPTTMRPPYGDIDDRVRAISLAMGLTPVIWTSVGQQNFDTEDWRLGDPSLGETEASIMQNFNRFLELSKELTTGFIVLAHDLYPQSVDLALNRILPGARSFQPTLRLMPIISCQDKPLSAAYLETSANNNATSPSSAASSVSSASASSASAPASSSAASVSASAPNQSAQPSGSARPTSGAAPLRVSAGVAVGFLGAILLW